MASERPEGPDHRLTRRQTLGIAGAAGSAVVLGGTAGKAISALADSDEVSAATAAKACKLTPEVTEGPFYVALDKIRRDITEGRPGVPLTLKVRVVDVKRCAPIHIAAVDIWHCDAGGLYSDESSNGTAGQTYLRGVQLTNKKGFAKFHTVYPGHYSGRATHIHLKVHIGGKARGGTLRGGHVSHKGSASSGFVGTIVLGVNPKATPAAV
jgi:protocatechuate 3,4-dioxygenase beta subunit